VVKICRVIQTKLNQLVSENVRSKMYFLTKQKGQHPLTGQRAANFKLSFL